MLKNFLSAVALTLAFSSASASVIAPTVGFTLRSYVNAGPAYYIDDTWNNDGILGLLTNMEGSQVDRTYFEFSNTSLGKPVARAVLNFNLSGTPIAVIHMNSYAADGLAEMGDWNVSQTAFTSFGAGLNSYSIDITEIVNSAANDSDYLGLSFSIDTNQSQATFSWPNMPTIEISTSTIPEPNTLLIVSLAFGALLLSKSSARASSLKSPPPQR